MESSGVPCSQFHDGPTWQQRHKALRARMRSVHKNKHPPFDQIFLHVYIRLGALEVEARALQGENALLEDSPV